MDLIGKVLWWDKRDQEGVLVASDGRKFYFNESVIRKVSYRGVREGALVKFQIHPHVKHILCANKVAFLKAAERTAAAHSFERKEAQL